MMLYPRNRKCYIQGRDLAAWLTWCWFIVLFVIFGTAIYTRHLIILIIIPCKSIYGYWLASRLVNYCLFWSIKIDKSLFMHSLDTSRHNSHKITNNLKVTFITNKQLLLIFYICIYISSRFNHMNMLLLQFYSYNFIK